MPTVTGKDNVNVTRAGPDQTVQTMMVYVIANVITAAMDQQHMTVTAVLKMPFVTTMQTSDLTRSVSVTNGGQVMTVASIVDHVLLLVMVVQDQELTIVKTV